ncbi:MAG: TIGR03118 family protein [Steroidobacteraceae bacterium]
MYSGNAQQSVALTVTAPSAFSATSLVADVAGGGSLTSDANLVNPWGIAFGPTTFSWVANSHSETSTLYDGNGHAQPAAGPLVVSFAASGAGAASIPPASSTTARRTSRSPPAPRPAPRASSSSARAECSRAGPRAWISPTRSTYTDAGGAVYKGLAIANNGSGNFLYATDFHNGKVDVFDATFTKQTPTASSFAFTDPTLPAGYAPFGIQALPTGTNGATQIYVTYAQQNPPGNDNANGAGLGLVDVYDTNGNFVSHLVPVGGLLNAPWGLALAPADFGTLGNALLVGNFGDGKINAFNPSTGAYVGTVANAAGGAFAVPGLWGIAFGNDAANQPHNTLFYAAGTNNEANGDYGRIDVGANPPVLNQPPVVAVHGPGRLRQRHRHRDGHRASPSPGSSSSSAAPQLGVVTTPPTPSSGTRPRWPTAASLGWSRPTSTATSAPRPASPSR